MGFGVRFETNEDLKKQRLSHKPSKFEEFLKNKLKVAFTDSRERMAYHENAFFGLIAAPELDMMGAAAVYLTDGSSVSHLEDIVHRTKKGVVNIGKSGSYFLAETLREDGVIEARGNYGDYLGFISIRNPNQERRPYSIRSAHVVQKDLIPIFDTITGGPLIMYGNSIINIFPGPFTSIGGLCQKPAYLKIVDEHSRGGSKDYDISLSFAGRGWRNQTNTQLKNLGLIYTRTHPFLDLEEEAKLILWNDSKFPEQNYSIQIKIA